MVALPRQPRPAVTRKRLPAHETTLACCSEHGHRAASRHEEGWEASEDDTPSALDDLIYAPPWLSFDAWGKVTEERAPRSPRDFQLATYQRAMNEYRAMHGAIGSSGLWSFETEAEQAARNGRPQLLRLRRAGQAVRSMPKPGVRRQPLRAPKGKVVLGGKKPLRLLRVR